MFADTDTSTRVTGHAAALAHGAVLLGGWLWLGLQGMRLGWSLGGGLGVVALWWALRLLCRHWAPAVPRGPAAPWLLGAVTASGVLLIEGAELGGMGLLVLLGTALAWALWCHTLTPGGVGQRDPSTHAHPAQAGGAAMGMPRSMSSPTSTSTSGSGSTGTIMWTATAPALAAHALPATAMGLMMGTLWLSSQWCATAGWPPNTLVAVHVACMLVLPALLQRPRAALQRQPAWRHGLPLALLALGGLVLAASATASGWMAGMVLQALAWALTPAAGTAQNPAPSACTRDKAVAGHDCLPHRLLTFALALGGPLLLWWVGLLSPTTGPDALHGAQALLGALALAALLPWLWRNARRALTLHLPSTPSADAP